MNSSEKEKLSEKLLVTERFQVVKREYTDNQGNSLSRAIIEHPGAVVILPLLSDNRICLIKNKRIAVNQTLVELPAGTLDPAEAPLVCAARELQEETGYRAEKLELLYEFYVSPGILNERMYLFLATGLSEGETALELGEMIEPCIVTLEEALEMIDHRQIEDAKTLFGLLYYQRIRSQKLAKS